MAAPSAMSSARATRLRCMTAYTIRPETSDDVPAIGQLHRAAFETGYEAQLVEDLRANRSVWEPGVSRVAVGQSGQILAHALLTRCWVGSVPVLALAPVAVASTHQKQGIGSELTRSVLSAAREKALQLNEPACVLVLGHPAFYNALGFEQSRFHGIKTSMNVPAEAFMVLNLNPAFDLPSGEVIYPAEFGLSEDDDL